MIATALSAGECQIREHGKDAGIFHLAVQQAVFRAPVIGDHISQ
ncbi:hypothetical protein [Streptomyces sp. NBC_00009]